MRLIALTGLLLANDLGSGCISAAAFILARLLGRFLLPACGFLAFLFQPLLGGSAVRFGLNPGVLCLLGLQLELKALVLGFALLCCCLVNQLLLATGGRFSRCLLFLGYALAFGLDGSLLCCPDAVLLGTLV